MSENFETKLEYAKKILETLSDPEITLDKSVNAYKEGMEALKEASKMLEDAKASYEEMKQKDDTQ